MIRERSFSFYNFFHKRFPENSVLKIIFKYWNRMLPSPKFKPLQYFQYKECVYVAMHLRSSYIPQKSKNYKTSFLSTSVEWCRAVYVSCDEGWLRLLSDSIIPHSPNSALNWEGRSRQTRERVTFCTHFSFCESHMRSPFLASSKETFLYTCNAVEREHQTWN